MTKAEWDVLKEKEERMAFDLRRDALREQRRARDTARRQGRVPISTEVAAARCPRCGQCTVLAPKRQRDKRGGGR
jgi:hypothetical protein